MIKNHSNVSFLSLVIYLIAINISLIILLNINEQYASIDLDLLLYMQLPFIFIRRIMPYGRILRHAELCRPVVASHLLMYIALSSFVAITPIYFSASLAFWFVATKLSILNLTVTIYYSDYGLVRLGGGIND